MSGGPTSRDGATPRRRPAWRCPGVPAAHRRGSLSRPRFAPSHPKIADPLPPTQVRSAHPIDGGTSCQCSPGGVSSPQPRHPVSRSERRAHRRSERGVRCSVGCRRTHHPVPACRTAGSTSPTSTTRPAQDSLAVPGIDGKSGVILNVTVTETEGAGFFRIADEFEAVPTTSNINWYGDRPDAREHGDRDDGCACDGHHGARWRERSGAPRDRRARLRGLNRDRFSGRIAWHPRRVSVFRSDRVAVRRARRSARRRGTPPGR